MESSRDSSGTAATPLGFTWMAKAGKGGIWPGVQDGMLGMLVVSAVDQLKHLLYLLFLVRSSH